MSQTRGNKRRNQLTGDNGSLLIRQAVAGESARLSVIAFTSKAWWGYSDAFMANCRDELSWSETDIASDQQGTFVCELAGEVIGFYQLDFADPARPDLDAMFLLPDHIGRGFGSRLMQHALEQVRWRGANLLTVQSDPYAEHFYLSQGARRIGECESHSIAGRFLPLLEFDLAG